MGQEIESTRFTAADRAEYDRRLQAETRLLQVWFEEQRFSRRDRVGGFELEAWLIDEQARPAPCNEVFLQRMNNPLVVPELALFNVELNGAPQVLSGRAFSLLQEDLSRTWATCQQTAADMGLRLLMTGILPTVSEAELVEGNMSQLRRYRALNQQVLAQRQGHPLHLDIQGVDHLSSVHDDVMLEAATTSFQIHYKVAQKQAARAYNLAQILSAPMVAVSANSPYLFGNDLWDETRIPLFEQSVEVGGFAGAAHGPVRRVSFGSGYVHASLFECFAENRDHFPVLLPILFDEPAEHMAHLRLHNGTIWRWNRPLIDFDSDGTPHIRIEHRVVPSGPTVIDGLANAVFYFGLMAFLLERDTPPELQLPFSVARDNFYHAAQQGLDAQLQWLDGRKANAAQLIENTLLPMAQAGLENLTIDADDSRRFLDIIRRRVQNRCNGAAWQRAWVSKFGPDWVGLTERYYDNQQSGMPVHDWTL